MSLLEPGGVGSLVFCRAIHVSAFDEGLTNDVGWSVSLDGGSYNKQRSEAYHEEE